MYKARNGSKPPNSDTEHTFREINPRHNVDPFYANPYCLPAPGLVEILLEKPLGTESAALCRGGRGVILGLQSNLVSNICKLICFLGAMILGEIFMIWSFLVVS